MELLRTELIRQLPIAKSLDNSTRADIQAYCDILSPFKMEVGCLEGLGESVKNWGTMMRTGITMKDNTTLSRDYNGNAGEK